MIERESQISASTNEAQSSDVLLIVGAVITRCSSWGGKHADLLIVTNGDDLNAGLARQFPDAEVSAHELDPIATIACTLGQVCRDDLQPL